MNCKELDSLLQTRLNDFFIKRGFHLVKCIDGKGSSMVIYRSGELYLKFIIEKGMIEYKIGDRYATLDWGLEHWFSLESINEYLNPSPLTVDYPMQKIPSIDEQVEKIRIMHDKLYERVSEFLMEDGELNDRLQNYDLFSKKRIQEWLQMKYKAVKERNKTE